MPCTIAIVIQQHSCFAFITPDTQTKTVWDLIQQTSQAHPKQASRCNTKDPTIHLRLSKATLHTSLYSCAGLHARVFASLQVLNPLLGLV